MQTRSLRSLARVRAPGLLGTFRQSAAGIDTVVRSLRQMSPVMTSARQDGGRKDSRGRDRHDHWELGVGKPGVAMATAVVAAALILWRVQGQRRSEEGGLSCDAPVDELALPCAAGGLLISRGKTISAVDADGTTPIAVPLLERDEQSTKELIVILGTGWAATGLLKTLDKDAYDVVVVSPSNYFLFTPLLPEAATGTVEARSLMESSRKICADHNATYLEAEATDLNPTSRQVTIKTRAGRLFVVPYDRLIVAVGAQNNTFGVPGVTDHAHFLKDINDARRIRYKIMSLFEEAATPISHAERDRLLTFVVAGGGPTGVEFAAELNDFIHGDLHRFFPGLRARVVLVNSGDHILNTFTSAISAMTEKHFRQNDIEIVSNARVIAVRGDRLVCKSKGTNEEFEIPFGLCVWSTGIGMRPFAEKIGKMLGQVKSRALVTDNRLRLLNAPKDQIYALGDCATIENPRVMNIVTDYLSTAAGHSEFQRLSRQQFHDVAQRCRARYPQTGVILDKIDDVFDKFDVDHSGYLEKAEIVDLVKFIDSKLTSLPATAQVASQQGKYLAQQLNSISKIPSSARAELTETHTHPFRYAHLGSFSYIGGDRAVVDLNTAAGGVSAGGIGVFWLWRGAFLSEQVSLRTRVLLAIDWVKARVFGRDMSRS